MPEVPYTSQPPQYSGYVPPPPRKTRWWIPVVIILGVFVVFIIGIIALVAGVATSLGGGSKKVAAVKSNSILSLNLSRPLREYNSQSGLFNKQDPATFLEILTALKRAKNDDNIKGIYIKSGSGNGFAKMTELHEALAEFKKSGKFIYAFIETGERADYYSTLSADSIFMPREGYIQLNASGASVMFYKGLFEKLGIDAHVEQFEEYKSFGEPYSRKNFSEPAKDELRTLISQRSEAFLSAISQARKLPLEDVRLAINRGIYTADSMLGNHMIDGYASEQQVKDKLKTRAKAPEEGKKEAKLRLVSMDDYVNSSSGANTSVADVKNQIAIIYASGAIRTGKRDGGGPFGGGNMEIASESFISDLKKARENEFITAIILRIDSPGGSALASDVMWEEIQKTRKVKPVYASMSDVAASGGYYMAMACDTIIAHPLTVTGSVGVIGILPTFSGSLGKMGISIDTITTGRSSHFMSPYLPHNQQDLEQFHGLMAGTYHRFVTKAADSRHKSYEDMRALAKGRVWSGTDAKNVGLVDVLGGWQTTLSLVKKRIGIPDTMRAMVQIFPKPQDQIEDLLRMFGISMDGDEDEESSGDDNQERLNNVLRQTMGAAAWTAFTQQSALPESMRRQFSNGYSILSISMKEHALMAMPYSFE
ncbi:MAG: signal peptide peptidase SppA [Ignavibacteria bacterium]|nr:signal peptide peptidase SppA [Ignavibacteria bacterium]